VGSPVGDGERGDGVRDDGPGEGDAGADGGRAEDGVGRALGASDGVDPVSPGGDEVREIPGDRAGCPSVTVSGNGRTSR
jgi:hypothetical protein